MDSKAIATAQDLQPNNARREVVFVDIGVADYQSLINGLPAGVDVVLLDASQDGLTQMAAYLDGQTGIGAIHVLSHGSSGSVRLGSMTLDAAALDARTEDLTRIGAALSAEGDILLYGCNVATGQTGAEFIGKLAQVTGADVAASDDVTGAAAKGGDWVLEQLTGGIETHQIQATAFSALLSTFDLTDATGGVDCNFVSWGGDDKVVQQTIGSDTMVITATTYNIAKDLEEYIFGFEHDASLSENVILPGINGSGGSGSTDYETKVTITVAGGKVFDLSSFTLVNFANSLKDLKITTDKGSATLTKNFVSDVWDVSFSGAIYQGVTYAEITTGDGTGFSWCMDNFVLSNIGASNTAPTLANLNGGSTYTENASPIVIDSDVTVADTELDALNSGNGDYNGASVTIARNGGANAQDVFGNTASLGTLTQGQSFTYNGTSVGTVTTNSGGTLVLTFNTNATSTMVDSVLQSITYSNSSEAPPASVTLN